MAKSNFISKYKIKHSRTDLILKNKQIKNNEIFKSKLNSLKKTIKKIDNITHKLNRLIDERITLEKQRNDLIQNIDNQYKHLQKLKKTRYTCHYCKKKFQPQALNKKFKFCSYECDYQYDNEKNRIKNAPIIRKRKQRILNKKIKERDRVEKRLIQRLSEIKKAKTRLITNRDQLA